jgi:hypothetical protein
MTTALGAGLLSIPGDILDLQDAFRDGSDSSTAGKASAVLSTVSDAF